MPANMMNALVGSRANVTGSSRATVNAGPMPGSTPTAVPRVAPANAQARCGSVSAPANPWLSACSVSMQIQEIAVAVAAQSQPAKTPAGNVTFSTRTNSRYAPTETP